MRGIFTGDWHLGLSVEDLDRTPDVEKVIGEIVDYAIKEQVDFVSIGGDLTDNNTPLPDHLAVLISALNRLEGAGIVTFINRGNHEAISAADRFWALTPLERVGYQNVHFIVEPKLMRFDEITFLFLPHTTRAQAAAAGFKTAQEYIDSKAEELVEKSDRKVTVISHYNVNGAKAGTEALMLRQTDLQLPAVITRSPKVAKIINSHIHTAQDRGKIVMPGSPICTDFGDLESPKGFLVGEFDGEKWEFEQVLTTASPMVEMEIDLVKKTIEQIRKEVQTASKAIIKDAILKVRVLIDEENLPLVDFDKLRDEFGKSARYVKQIDRIVMRKRQVRDREQKPGLSPLDAVKRYIEVRKPEGADRKLDLAARIIEGVEVEMKDSGSSFLNETAAMDSLDRSLEKLSPPVKRKMMSMGVGDDLSLDF